MSVCSTIVCTILLNVIHSLWCECMQYCCMHYFTQCNTLFVMWVYAVLLHVLFYPYTLCGVSVCSTVVCTILLNVIHSLWCECIVCSTIVCTILLNVIHSLWCECMQYCCMYYFTQCNTLFVMWVYAVLLYVLFYSM